MLKRALGALFETPMPINKLKRQEATARSIMKAAIFVSGPRGRKAAISASKDVVRTRLERTMLENRKKRDKAVQGRKK